MDTLYDKPEDIRPDSTLASLLERMNTAVLTKEREDEEENSKVTPSHNIASGEPLSTWTEPVTRKSGNPNWYKGMPSPNPNAHSRKPLTDALNAVLPPKELAEIIATNARKGKDWAVRLAATYTQTPETLNRISDNREEERTALERLVLQAKELGVSLDDALAESEARLHKAYEELEPAGIAPVLGASEGGALADADAG